MPIDQRPFDNEYAWKGNPYAVDGVAETRRDVDPVRLRRSSRSLVQRFDRPRVHDSRRHENVDRGELRINGREGEAPRRVEIEDVYGMGGNRSRHRHHSRRRNVVARFRRQTSLRRAERARNSPSTAGWRIPIVTWSSRQRKA